MAIEPLLGGQGVRFDPLTLNWIGSTSPEVSVIAVRTDAGVRSLDEAMRKEVILAGPAPGTDGVTFPTALNNLLGTKFKIVSGYRSGKEMALAVARNEVQGRGSWSWASFQVEALDLVRKGEMQILVQMALARSPELPDVPCAMDFAKTDDQRQILELLLAGQAMAWPIFAAGGVPAERVTLLRQAYLAMLRDRDVLADAKKTGIEIEPVSGEDIDRMLKRLYASPPDIVRKARELAGRG
jgi:tripartite-type tricarboxylate transporter receptor subunit TctC